jgi:hypothetical protein
MRPNWTSSEASTARSRPAGRRKYRSFAQPDLEGAQGEEHRAGGEEEQQGFEDHWINLTTSAANCDATLMRPWVGMIIDADPGNVRGRL